MNYKKINNLDELDAELESGNHDYFVWLGGCRSSKCIYRNSDGSYYVENEIDGSDDRLTRKQMLDEKRTNIGIAMGRGAFYAYPM